MSELEIYKGMVKKMKNVEIKEKLKLIDGFFNKAWACDLDEVYHAVIDTITNLQQENERLKEKSINEVLKNDFDMCVKDLKKANKKIEKAFEIAKDLKQFVYDELVDRNVSGATETHDKIRNLLNTLNGRSDE